MRCLSYIMSLELISFNSEWLWQDYPASSALRKAAGTCGEHQDMRR